MFEIGQRVFQLSHVLSDMEMLGSIRWFENTAVYVSIGPRPSRHGNLSIKDIRFYAINLSFNWATSFQTWKCEPTGTRYRAIYDWFQLGHVFSDMEIMKLHYTGKDLPGFNWATSFQTWKSAGRQSLHGRHRGFNWATSFQTWKFCIISEGKTKQIWVSIGPRPFRHGNT